MRWMIEDAVVVWAAIALGAGGAIWLTPSVALRGHADTDVAPVAVEAAAPWDTDDFGEVPIFAATSIRSGFSINGSYVGRMRFEAADIVLDVERAMAVSDGSNDGMQLVGVRLSLAERTDDGGWRLVERGELSFVGVDMTDRTTWRPQGSVTLRLPSVSMPDLIERWFVIEHELWIEPADGGKAHPAWTYVHADLSFTARWLATMDGC